MAFLWKHAFISRRCFYVKAFIKQQSCTLWCIPNMVLEYLYSFILNGGLCCIYLGINLHSYQWGYWFSPFCHKSVWFKSPRACYSMGIHAMFSLGPLLPFVYVFSGKKSDCKYIKLMSSMVDDFRKRAIVKILNAISIFFHFSIVYVATMML